MTQFPISSPFGKGGLGGFEILSSFTNPSALRASPFRKGRESIGKLSGFARLGVAKKIH
jgi:hypothetical protein